MIWIVRCSLRTYLSHPLTSSTLHAVPELVQDKEDFTFAPPASVEALSGLTGSILMFHLKGKRRFPSTFPSRRLRSWTPLTFQFHLAWTHSEVRRTFSGASPCPGCTSPPPWMHWGLSILSQSAYAKRSFNLLFPALAQRRGGLLLFLACTRSRARRTSFLSRLHSLKGEEDFFFRLKMHEIVEGFLHYWCLRSPKDNEVFKTFNYCHRLPKNDGDFKTFNYCHRSPKTMETLKLLTITHAI